MMIEDIVAMEIEIVAAKEAIVVEEVRALINKDFTATKLLMSISKENCLT